MTTVEMMALEVLKGDMDVAVSLAYIIIRSQAKPSAEIESKLPKTEEVQNAITINAKERRLLRRLLDITRQRDNLKLRD